MPKFLLTGLMRPNRTHWYLTCWLVMVEGSWPAWTWADHSAAPPWKAPLNALQGGEGERHQTGRRQLGSPAINSFSSFEYTFISSNHDRGRAAAPRLWSFSSEAGRTVNVTSISGGLRCRTDGCTLTWDQHDNTVYLAAVGKSSPPCTLRGCGASLHGCQPALWSARRRSGRSGPGSGRPAPARRGWL